MKRELLCLNKANALQGYIRNIHIQGNRRQLNVIFFKYFERDYPLNSNFWAVINSKANHAISTYCQGSSPTSIISSLSSVNTTNHFLLREINSPLNSKILSSSVIGSS